MLAGGAERYRARESPLLALARAAIRSIRRRSMQSIALA
jgi:hypothetical protein